MQIYPYIFSFGFYGTVLWWMLVSALLVLAGGWTYDSVLRSHSEKSAMEIIKLRYAKGQISKQKFEEMKKELESDMRPHLSPLHF